MYSECGCCEAPTPKEEDLSAQSGVLAHLLIEHPIQFTEAEIIRAVTRGSDDFGECDAAGEAIVQLVAVGLLHRQERFVVPSVAAFRVYEVWDL